MRKILYLFLGLVFLSLTSCEKDEDAIYVNHKLTLNVEKNTEYYSEIIEFSWNEVILVDHKGYLLVQFYEEKDATLYDDIVDYILNFEDYYFYPAEWKDYCYIYPVSANSTSFQKYDYSTTEDKDYYVLLAYDSNGKYIVSNSVYI